MHAHATHGCPSCPPREIHPTRVELLLCSSLGCVTAYWATCGRCDAKLCASCIETHPAECWKSKEAISQYRRHYV